MKTFKTLDELDEYNNKAFEQTFESIKYQRPENPFEKNSWEALKFNARPHDVFKLDWSSYSSLDFADKFLPYIKNAYKGKALWMYDGAELFNNLKKAEQKLFKFDDNRHLISLINYTYPKGVLAGNKKGIANVAEHEVLTFIEVDEHDAIDISFKFGKRFKGHLERYFKEIGVSKSISDLENKTYNTNKQSFNGFFNSELVHYSMMSFIFETLGINLNSYYELESDFAELQLKKVAKDLGKFSFVIFMLNIFGEDIEVKALLKLYHHLLEDDMPKPKIETTTEPLNGRKANYNSNNNTIYVWEYFIDQATSSEESSAELLIALIEEYGHFLDNLLRNSLASKIVEDEDYLDEGAKFSFFFLNHDALNLKEIKYAHGHSGNYSGVFSVSLDTLKKVLKTVFSKSSFFDANPNETLEGFGAGFEPGTHGGIELKALKSDFEEHEILQIYYGNWLRDYSQVLVGATVRITEEAKKELEKDVSSNYMSKLLKQNSDKVSHEGWVTLLENLAAKEFVFQAEEQNKEFTGKAKDYVNKFREKYGKLNKDMLGVYRPEEHIDNPKELPDESKYPIYFNYEYPKGKTQKRTLYHGELEASLKIDDVVCAKKYIHTNLENRPAVASYLKEQIELAVSYGQNKKGFRHFGAALHVLEDYFAHTNYTELALIKAGNKKVYPWVEGMQGKDYTSIPIVTGVFLTDDTLASVLPKVANSMFPIGYHDYVQRKPKDRTFGDLFILSLLEDLSKAKSEEMYFGFTIKDWLNGYRFYLDLVDKKSEFIKELGIIGRFFDKYLQRASETFSTFNNLAFNLLLRSADETIKESQTHTTNKNYGTDPTHTQIAKDAENHPLNELASDLATIAVTDVGQKIKAIWQGASSVSGEELGNYIVNTYIQHPKFTIWEEKIIGKWSENEKNKLIIKRLENPTLYEYSEQVLQRTIKNEAIQNILEFFKK